MKKVFVTITVILLTLSFAVQLYAAPYQTRNIPTSGGSRNVTMVEFNLDENYIVKGLIAQDVLGRPAGTLSDFAQAMAGYMGDDTIIFPGSFHVTGSPEIVGAIYSHGRVVSGDPQPWLNHGVGFTAENRLSFFRGRLNDGHIYGYNWDDDRLPYVMAFNVFPHLISNGTRLPIEEMPGATRAWLDGRVLRAIMGQRADGSFVIANIPGASMEEAQDVAAYLGLHNATNIDGGASTGIWRNGSYITTPSRLLPHVIFITRVTPAPPEGVLRFVIGSVTFTNGGVVHILEAAPFIAYDRVMVPLRVIGDALGATNLAHNAGVISFEIDGRDFSMTVGEPLPGNMGTPVIVAGRTFVPLGFIANEMGADARWDSANRAAYIYID